MLQREHVAEHSTGRKDKPSAAGVIAFILLLLVIPEFVLPFVFDTVGAHTVGIILIIITITSLCGCMEELEKNEGKHKPEDEWTTDDWGDER